MEETWYLLNRMASEPPVTVWLAGGDGPAIRR